MVKFGTFETGHTNALNYGDDVDDSPVPPRSQNPLKTLFGKILPQPLATGDVQKRGQSEVYTKDQSLRARDLEKLHGKVPKPKTAAEQLVELRGKLPEPKTHTQQVTELRGKTYRFGEQLTGEQRLQAHLAAQRQAEDDSNY